MFGRIYMPLVVCIMNTWSLHMLIGTYIYTLGCDAKTVCGIQRVKSSLLLLFMVEFLSFNF